MNVEMLRQSLELDSLAKMKYTVFVSRDIWVSNPARILRFLCLQVEYGQQQNTGERDQ
jgi:hypothetical protein